ncbi:MAG: type III-A CRISPR-associated RAMP protein Csm4 [Flammeovirgaceae bacterium]
MQKEIVKLSFSEPLHLSKGKDNFDSSETVIHSDTIKSAIFACMMQLFGNQVTVNGEVYTDTELFAAFQVSSAFPYYQSTLFLPKPMKDADLFMGVKEEDRKQVKKIAYLTTAEFQKIAQGEKCYFDPKKHHKNAIFYGDTSVPKSLFKNEVLQRVAIPRMLTNDATPFYMDKLYFQEGAGLYFIFTVNNEVLKPYVKAGLKLLSENGLGTDRSVGQGGFTYQFDTLSLSLPEDGKEQMALSLFCPKNQQDLPPLNASYYKLIKRGGWIASPLNEHHMSLRKKSIYMFAEGSVFPKHNYQGKVVDLKPDILKEDQHHAIWRDGTPIFLPINLNAS